MDLAPGLTRREVLDVDAARRDAERQGYTTFVLPAEGVDSRAAFFDAVRATLPLDPPLASDHAWDALSDSLWEGLCAHPAERLAILWPNTRAMESTAPAELARAVRVLASVANSLSNPLATGGRTKTLTVIIESSISFPPRVMGSWIELSSAGREAWLVQAVDHYFAMGHRSIVTKPAGSVIALDCASISDTAAFWCCLGEAVQGPGGYFGSDIGSLDDCLVGGFGVDTPCELRLTDESVLYTVLGGAALAAWAQQRLDVGDFHDEQGRQWLLQMGREGSVGARTLWGELREVFRAHHVEVIDASASGRR